MRHENVAAFGVPSVSMKVQGLMLQCTLTSAEAAVMISR